ncbi:MAG TPA: flagellar hook-basal body complex protein FliE [Candidatus Sulfotelmatobacter sp.]|nr:flagellar hook-basal body complex protein FliE [Candidatus Sulfotelmatobacter sp.]
MSSPISSLRILPAEVGAPSFGTSEPTETGFRDMLHSAIDDMQNLESQAEAKVSGVIDGNGADVHSAMIAVEKADLSFQLMMQVRNKIVSAYEEISRMQF